MTPPSRTTANAVATASASADAFEHRMRTVTAGELAHSLDALLATLRDHIGRTEIAAQIRAGLVAPHEDDPLSAEAPGCKHRA